MSSTNIYLHLPIRVRAFSSREEGETVLEEKPVKEVEVNEFDHKSFSCGSSLRAADAIYSRTITKSDRDKFVDAKAKVTPKCATPPSFICVPDVKPSGDNAFVKSIGIANVFTNVSPGNRGKGGKIDCFSFGRFTTRLLRASRIYEAVARLRESKILF